jgi:hypothetical protein
MANDVGILLGFVIIFIILLMNFLKYGKIISDFFEPTTFYMAFIFVFFIINYTTSFEYNINTVFVVFVGSIFYIIGYYSKLYLLFKSRKNFFKYDVLNDIKAKKYILSTVIVSILNVLVFMIKLKSFGISFSAFLTNMMLVSSAAKVGGYVWIALSYPLSVMNYINIYRFIQNKKSSSFVIIILCQILFTISQFQTSRFIYILNVIFLPLLIKMIFIDKKPVFNVKLLVIGVGILPLMIILNEIRHGNISQISFSVSSLLRYLQDSLKGDTIPGRALNDLVIFVDNNKHYNMGKYIIFQIFALVPRFIWVSKPIVSFCFQYTILVMNLDPVLDKTMTFTIFDVYTMFFYPGLIMMQLFLGAFSRWIYHLLYNRKNIFVLAFVIPFSLNYINTLRGSFVDQISLLILYVIINTLIYMYFRVFKNKIMVKT